MPSPTDPKAQWRVWAKETREALPERSSEVCAHLVTFLQGQGVRRVAAYRAMTGEVDVALLAEHFELLTPRSRYKPERHLTFHHWETATQPNKFGLIEPPLGAEVVPLETIDAVLLPGLAYDLSGVRLGYGGGFYDRLLPNYAGLTVGVMWQELIVPALPHEWHDLKVQYLATQAGVRPVEAR